MKAITLWQPWASLVACGVKKYETRSWKTAYRGRIAVHAAKRRPVSALGWSKDLLELSRSKVGEFRDLPRGVVVAVANLSYVWEASKAASYGVGELEMELGDWTPGRFVWRMQDVVRLVIPIEARGAQGLWNFDPGWEVVASGVRGKRLAWMEQRMSEVGVLWKEEKSFGAPVVLAANKHAVDAIKVFESVRDFGDYDARFDLGFEGSG
jgi:hypothetical protein